MVKKKAPKTNIIVGFAAIFLLSAITLFTLAKEQKSLATCTHQKSDVTCNESTELDVKVYEVLTVSITRPSVWASGNINTLLTNKVGISVISNNPAGFIATMKSSSATPNLVNQTDNSFIIPTLTDAVTLADSTDSTGLFPANKWGYNVVASNASAPSAYYAMVGSGDTPVEIASTKVASNAVAKDIYFAAKADGSIASGVYTNNVIINVVSGIISQDNPVNPVNPIRPIDGGGADYVSNIGNTSGAFINTTIDGDTTTTESYADPAGVTTSTSSSVNEGFPLATGLAITAGVAAAAGLILFIVAKRRREEEEEDDYYDGNPEE